MYCSNCGIENNKDSKFCYNCGKALVSKQDTTVINSGNQETSLILGVICLVSSFIVNIFCFIPGIISIVYANKYKKESGKLGVGFGLSLGGMIFSFIALIIGILLFLFFVNVVDESIKNEYNNDYNYNVNTEFTENLPSV